MVQFVTKVICFGWIANIAVIELLVLSMKPNIHSFTCFLGPYRMDIAQIHRWLDHFGFVLYI